MNKILFAIAVLGLPTPAYAQTTTTYQYDALGRLVGSTNTTGATNVQTAIEYDAAGNRKTYRVSGAPNGGADSGSGASAPNARRFVVVPLNGFTIIPIG